MALYGFLSCMTGFTVSGTSNASEEELPVEELPVDVESATAAEDLSATQATDDYHVNPVESAECYVTSSSVVSPPPSSPTAISSDACLLDIMAEAMGRLTGTATESTGLDLDAVVAAPSDKGSEVALANELRPIKSVTAVPVPEEESQIMFTDDQFSSALSKVPSDTNLIDVIEFRAKPIESVTELDTGFPALRNQPKASGTANLGQRPIKAFRTYVTCQRTGRKTSTTYLYSGNSACNVIGATRLMDCPVLPTRTLFVYAVSEFDMSAPRHLTSRIKFNIRVVPRGDEWVYAEYSFCKGGIDAFTLDGEIKHVIPHYVEDKINPDMSEFKAFFRNAAYILNNYETQAWINGVTLELPRIPKYRIKIVKISIAPGEVVLDVNGLLNIMMERSSKNIKIEGTEIGSFTQKTFEMVVSNNSDEDDNGNSNVNLDGATIYRLDDGHIRIYLPPYNEIASLEDMNSQKDLHFIPSQKFFH